jgi:hypothetical protein
MEDAMATWTTPKGTEMTVIAAQGRVIVRVAGKDRQVYDLDTPYHGDGLVRFDLDGRSAAAVIPAEMIAPVKLIKKAADEARAQAAAEHNSKVTTGTLAYHMYSPNGKLFG